jgi:FG-GAP-like repeat
VRKVLWLTAWTALVGFTAACSSSPGGVAGPPGTLDASGGAGGGDGGIVIDSGGGGPQHCGPNEPCESGVCANGICCPSANDACGSRCCPAEQVCLFDQCVVPGKACQSSSDCASGQYCETALGKSNADAGPGDAGGADATCTEPVANAGRCLKLPPQCPGDAGAPEGGSCIENCQYHPPPGKLDATVKWQWGQSIVPTVDPTFTDVWATPTVARVYDANCDGKVDENDPPDVIFVSGNAQQTCCSCGGYSPSTCLTGKLRMLDGQNGHDIWTLEKATPTSSGFAGMSVALGDIDGDGRIDIVAMTGEGYIAMIDANGKVERVSDQPVGGKGASAFGWGGGIAIGDMDGDGHPEIAFGRTLYSTTGNTITRLWVGTGGYGSSDGTADEALSFFSDLNGDGKLELVAGNTAYELDGSMLWNNTSLPDGFNAVADFDGDGNPDVVLIANGKIWILQGATGAIELGPVALPGTGNGGPPTVADFDGDGKPEIGVAMANKYSVMKPDYANHTINVLWSAANHDLSSSVTGSSVFDFQGDGKAEVIYNDECFLWVFDGQTGAVDLAVPTTSFTATEASLVADVDGDGHADIVMISNGADPSSAGWGCDVAPWNQPDPANNRPAWTAPAGAPAYRGITVYGDAQNSWVGTRTLWNEHAYHVSNICDSRDSACAAPNVYGSIPKHEKDNWKVPWLNDFRQNVQDKGIFDAPDATVSLTVDCTTPPVLHVSVRNIGSAGLPAGVQVDVFVEAGASETQLGTVTTTHALLPGQTETLDFTAPAGNSASQIYVARISTTNANFHECRTDNDSSAKASANCGPT